VNEGKREGEGEGQKERVREKGWEGRVRKGGDWGLHSAKSISNAYRDGGYRVKWRI